MAGAETRMIMTPHSLFTPSYLDLKNLAAYSSCSVRWLRDRLTDSRAPLPYHRVGGKILVRKDDFDLWMSGFRTIEAPTDIETIVNGVMAELLFKKPS